MGQQSSSELVEVVALEGCQSWPLTMVVGCGQSGSLEVVAKAGREVVARVEQ